MRAGIGFESRNVGYGSIVRGKRTRRGQPTDFGRKLRETAPQLHTNGMRLDKKTQKGKIDNTIEFEAIGSVLSPLIAFGHIHIFEALGSARTDSQSNPQ